MLLALALRLQFIENVQLYPDEFVTLLAVQMIGDHALPLMPSGLFYEHGLLFSYLGQIATWFGEARWAVRYVSLICGLATVGLTWFLAYRYVSLPAALLATTALAITPAAIEWSGRARMYALLQLLVLLTLWLAYEGLAHHRPRWRWGALLSYLAATLTHFVAVTLAPPLIIAALWPHYEKLCSDQADVAEESNGFSRYFWQWLKPLDSSISLTTTHYEKLRAFIKGAWLEALAFMLILLTAFMVKRAGQPKGIDPLDTGNAATSLLDVLRIYGDLSFNLLGGWQAISPFYVTLPALAILPFLLVALYGLFIKRESTSPAAPFNRFLSLILLLTTLEMILLVSPHRRDDKYLFMLLPLLYLIGGYGLHYLLSRLTSQLARNLISLAMCAMLIGVTWPQITTLLNNQGDDYDNAFAYVKANWQAGDSILTGTPAAAYFYLHRNDFYSVQKAGGYDYRILTVAGQPVDRWLASPALRTAEALHEVLAHQPVWLVLERWGLQQEYYDLDFQQQLLAQTEFMAEAQGIFILKSLPDPRPLLLEPQHPLEATFADQLRLKGYSLEPSTLTPGQPMRLTLYWQALAEIPHDYTIFVHLRPAADSTINLAQADHRPLDPIYPTHMWPINQTIRETSLLPLPADLPGGDYDLWVGLYRLETGERLPLNDDTSGEHAVKLRVNP